MKKDYFRALEKQQKELNQKSMKEVWKFYNQKLKKKSQMWIPLKDELETQEFMQYWTKLYKDNCGKNQL